MVYNIEKTIVNNCQFMARYRVAVSQWGFKWTIALIVVMFGFHIAAITTGVGELVWGSRLIMAFVIFSWIYDYMYGRVMGSRERWR